MKASKRRPAGSGSGVALSETQTKAVLEEWERRFRNLLEKWRLCPNRRCRRCKRCLGPVFVCMRHVWMRPPTKRQDQRLLREFRRKPMRPPSAT